MYYKFCMLSAAILSLIEVSQAYGQVKIEEQLNADVQTASRVRVLIVTRADLGDAGSAKASLQGLAATLGDSAKVRNIGDLPVASAEVTAESLEKLRENPNVVLVTRDVPMRASLSDSVPLVGAASARTAGLDGDGYVVAVLDTGVQVDHPALSGSIVKEACFSTVSAPDVNVESLCPGNFDVSLVAGAATKCPSTVHGCEHGTHVAGIVAGHQMTAEGKSFEGIAPAAKIIAVQVFTLFKDEETCGGQPSCVLSYTSDQLRALEWVYKQRNTFKIAAVNMSLGGGYHEGNCDHTSALTEIIERLRSKGIATVIAAGNDAFFDGMSEPACISSAVSVAAVNKENKLDIAYTNVSNFIHIAAPGTAIVSSVTGGGYKSMSGTSMAAPHVAAAFALLKEKFPTETVKQLETRLRTGASMAIDPRTDAALPVLEISHAVASNTEVQPPNGVTPVNDQELPAGEGNSYIIVTGKTSSEIEGRLQSTCPNFDCELKQISEDKYKIDVHPKGSIPTSKFDQNSMREKIQRTFPDAKVFDNRLSNPL